MIFNTLILSALASKVLAAPGSTHVLHEKRAVIDHSSRGERVPENAVIPIRIGLKQSNLEHGYDALMDVSDPDSENYG